MVVSVYIYIYLCLWQVFIIDCTRVVNFKQMSTFLQKSIGKLSTPKLVTAIATIVVCLPECDKGHVDGYFWAIWQPIAVRRIM